MGKVTVYALLAWSSQHGLPATPVGALAMDQATGAHAAAWLPLTYDACSAATRTCHTWRLPNRQDRSAAPLLLIRLHHVERDEADLFAQRRRGGLGAAHLLGHVGRDHRTPPSRSARTPRSPGSTWVRALRQGSPLPGPATALGSTAMSYRTNQTSPDLGRLRWSTRRRAFPRPDAVPEGLAEGQDGVAPTWGRPAYFDCSRMLWALPPPGRDTGRNQR
jgi:hypothetical protein